MVNMNFNGEIVFDIADDEHIEVDFGVKILPTKVVNKGDMVALGRKAPKTGGYMKLNMIMKANICRI